MEGGTNLRRKRMAVKSVTVGKRGSVGADPAAGWTRIGMRSRPRRWLASGVLLALVGLWILVLTLMFGSASHQRQQTFVASQDASNALSALLAQEAAIRGFEATGSRALLAPVLAGPGRVQSPLAAARAQVRSDRDLVRSVIHQVALDGEWENLANAETGSANPRAYARQTHA